MREKEGRGRNGDERGHRRGVGNRGGRRRGSPAWCQKQGREAANSPELNTPTASALGDGVGVVDGVWEATSQPVE
jgi:hypothetical protein